MNNTPSEEDGPSVLLRDVAGRRTPAALSSEGLPPAIEKFVVETLGDAGASFDRDDLAGTLTLLEALPEDVDRLLYDGLPDWIKNIIPRKRFLDEESENAARGLGFTRIQYLKAVVFAMAVAPMQILQRLRPNGRNGLTLIGNVEFRNMTVPGLPDDLSCGAMHLFDVSRLEELPARFHATSASFVSCPDLQRIGRALTVDGTLAFDDCPIEELPDDVAVRGTLSLRHCRELRRLPHRLNFRGTLVIEKCDAIERLPGEFLGSGAPVNIALCPQHLHAEAQRLLDAGKISSFS